MIITTLTIYSSATKSSTVIGIGITYCSSIEYCVAIHQTPTSTLAQLNKNETGSTFTISQVTRHPMMMEGILCCFIICYDMCSLPYAQYDKQLLLLLILLLRYRWKKRIHKIPKQWMNCVSYSITLFWNLQCTYAHKSVQSIDDYS